MKRPRLVAVILAGGSGTRFWPLSRKAHPKPLLRAGGPKSLLAEAVARARRFAAARDVWLVCGAEHAGAMRGIASCLLRVGDSRAAEIWARRAETRKG